MAAHYVGALLDWKPAYMAWVAEKADETLSLAHFFLRDVEGTRSKGAFADSLDNNGLAPEVEDIAKVLQALTTDVKEGSRMTFLGITDGGKPQKLIVSAKGPVEISGATTVDDIWKIRAGLKPADGGIEHLQEQLAKPIP